MLLYELIGHVEFHRETLSIYLAFTYTHLGQRRSVAFWPDVCGFYILRLSVYVIFGSEDYHFIEMTYTLLFGNNFISDCPKYVKCNNTTLFELGEDSEGPYLSTELCDASGERVSISIDRNICTYCAQGIILKKNERNHILIENKERENIIQSRILDGTTILVSGMFAVRGSVLIVTQNYVISPIGKRIMHSRISAKHSSIAVTDEELIPMNEINTN